MTLLVLLACLVGQLVGSRPAEASSSPVFGALDQAGTAIGPGIHVAGWAKDPDSSAPLEVHVYVDGRGAAILRADRFRIDLFSVLPGPSHGYDATVSTTVGTHSVCVFGIDAPGSGGGNGLLGCRTVDVRGALIGSLDLATDEGPTSLAGYHPAVVAGWAADPDSRAGVQVDVYVDGTFTSTVFATGGRDDVGRAYPGFDGSRSFSLSVPLPHGPHQVCVYALNVVGTPGDNALLGCRDVRSQRNLPFGAVDGVVPSDGHALWVSGWGIDPFSAVWTLTANGTSMQGYGPLETFVVEVDGVAHTTVQSNVDRGDVVALTPNGPPFRLNGGPRYGFQHTVQLPAGLAPGPHTICIVVEHHPYWDVPALAAPNARIGCRGITTN